MEKLTIFERMKKEPPTIFEIILGLSIGFSFSMSIVFIIHMLKFH